MKINATLNALACQRIFGVSFS